MTEMMKQYEAETGKKAERYIIVHVSVDGYDYGELVHDEEYVAWLEAKAEAYDRLMSGGKKTLKELANFLQRPIAIQPSRSGCVAVFANVPFLGETKWRGYWMSTIACDLDFSGDWQDSLTLPDSWETKQEKKKYKPFVKPKIEWLDDDFFIYTQKDKIKSKITRIERWNNTYLIKVVKVPQINYQDYIICSLKRLFKDYVFEDNSLLGEVRNNKTIETMENYIEDIANMNGEELDEFLNKGAENAQHVLDKLNMQQELNS